MQKHQYLIDVLKGEALQVVQRFHISDKNYENAWTLLKNTYDNQMLIIKTHLDALLQFPSILKKTRLIPFDNSYGIFTCIWSHCRTTSRRVKHDSNSSSKKETKFYQATWLAKRGQEQNTRKHANNGRISEILNRALSHN